MFGLSERVKHNLHRNIQKKKCSEIKPKPIINSSKTKSTIRLPGLDVKTTIHRKLIEKVNLDKYLRKDENSKPCSHRENLSNISTNNNSYNDSGKKSSLSNKQLVSIPLPYNFKRTNDRSLDVVREKNTDYVKRKYSKNIFL